jgi:long-chain acyl-CoA synthetase
MTESSTTFISQGDLKLEFVSGEPEQCIAERIRHHAQTKPDAPALVFGDRSISWRELNRDIELVSRSLVRVGAKPGDRVAILARNSAEFVVAILAITRAGMTVVPLPAMVTVHTWQKLLVDSSARVVIASAEFYEQVDRALSAGGVSIPRIAIGTAPSGWIDFASLLDPVQEATALPLPALNDAYNIIYSSGTTGTPKGIVHSQRHRARQSASFANLAFAAGGVVLISTPLYSNFSFGALLVSYWSGASVVLTAKFVEEEFLDLCRRYAPTHAFVVAVQIERLLAHADFDRSVGNLSMLKYTSGAPLRAETKRAVLDRWPGPFVEVYGATEGGAITVLFADRHPDKLESVGKPAGGGELFIIDDEGRIVQPGTIGEIVGRAGPAMEGYNNREDATRALHWTGPDGDVYLRSGDLGYLDEDGFLYLVGRKKDVIISGGFNVYASDIEELISQHPDVAEVAVIGVPSVRWGETPIAFVVARSGTALDQDELLAWANARLGNYQRLSAIEVRRELPRGPIGKILKQELRAPYWEG